MGLIVPRTLGIYLAFSILCIVVTTTGYAAPASDYHRLLEPTESNFKKPSILVYPLMNQEPLMETKPEAAGVTEALQVWRRLTSLLGQFGNLNVRGPDQTIAQIRATPNYQRSLKLARAIAQRGMREYKEVHLKTAAESLSTAVEAMIEIEHHLIAPVEVARLALTQALALLEHGDPVGAERTFRRALLTDPALRLKDGYDHPRSILALERSRTSLLEDGAPLPMGFRRDEQSPTPSNTFIIRSRFFDGRLEVHIASRQGKRLESLKLSSDFEADASRLASRIHASLPFGRSSRRRTHKDIGITIGFSQFLFLASPVGPFSHFGLALAGSWQTSRKVGLEFEALVSNSNRDEQEHLREDVSSLRIRVGPRFRHRTRNAEFFAVVGMETTYLDGLTITTQPGCKYFTPADDSPQNLCDFERDITRKDPTFAIGPAISLGIRLKLGDQVFMGLRGQTAAYVYSSGGYDLNFPVGASVDLGYQLF